MGGCTRIQGCGIHLQVQGSQEGVRVQSGQREGTGVCDIRPQLFLYRFQCEAVFSAVADFAIDVTFDNLFWREVTRGSFPEDGSDDSQTIILNGVFRSKQARLRVLSYHGEGPALASIHAFNPRTYDALKANLQIGFQWYFHPIMK